MATPPVSPSPSDGAEPVGFGAGSLVRQCALSAHDLAFSPEEMRDAHDLVEGNAWVPPAFRAQYYGHPPRAGDPWYLDPATQQVATWPTDPDTALAVPAAAGRIALATHQIQRALVHWEGEAEHNAGLAGILGIDGAPVAAHYRREHRLLVRLLVAHITGRPPVDEPTPEEAARRAALTQELAAERAAEEAADAAREAARRRRATEVWVRLISPQRGYIQIVGTIDDMERRRWEEAGPEDDIPAAIDPAAEGLFTADQLPAGVTNELLLRLLQIREELEMEYDSHYTDEDAIRRLKREETQILRAITAAFRAHRARYAPLAAHAAAVVDGSVRRARIHARRRAALVAWGLVN